MLEMLLPLLVTGIVGALLVPIGKLLLNANAWVDGLSDWVKRLIMAALAIGSTWLVAHSGISLPENLLVMDSTTLSALLTWAVSLAVHAFTKKSA